MKTLPAFALLAGSAACIPSLCSADCFHEPSPLTVRVGVHDIVPAGGTSQTAAGGITVESKAGLSFNIDYWVCHNVDVDVLGVNPFTQDIKLNGTRVGSTRHLPPTLTVRYHLVPDATIDPYVGVGVNRTFFFNESLPGANLQLSNTWGFAAQAGADWHFAKSWLLGVDVRYVQIEPNASVNGNAIGKVKIDPVVFGGNIGYRF